MDACLGSGAGIGVGVADAVGSIMGREVADTLAVGVAGRGVTGKAVGTGPAGSITFLA